MMNLAGAKNKAIRLLAGSAATLVTIFALLGPAALAPSHAGAAPGRDEYELNLPGESGQKSSDSGGSNVLVPIAIGAGVLTAVSILVLVRYRRRED